MLISMTAAQLIETFKGADQVDSIHFWNSKKTPAGHNDIYFCFLSETPMRAMRRICELLGLSMEIKHEAAPGDKWPSWSGQVSFPNRPITFTLDSESPDWRPDASIPEDFYAS